MYERKLKREIRCPLEYGLEIFGGKWKFRILCVLAAKGQLRYSALREEIGNITDPVLAAALKELQRDSVIYRYTFDEIPPHVEYTLAPKGQSVIPILQSICRWAGAYHREPGETPLPICDRCDYRPAEFT